MKISELSQHNPRALKELKGKEVEIISISNNKTYKRFQIWELPKPVKKSYKFKDFDINQ
jgi:hypothetical protein